MRPSNVGIHAMEIYFPSTYVSQQDLEVFDGVSKGTCVGRVLLGWGISF